MNYYKTNSGSNFLEEAQGYTPKDDHLKAIKRANAPVAKKTNKLQKSGTGFSDTPREGEARSVEAGVTLPKGKQKNEAKSAKEHGKDIENKEFDKGVYGFQSDLTGTIKGHDAKKVRSGRLSKTRMHRWSKALRKLTGTPSVQEAKGSPKEEEGDRGDPKSSDKALEGLFDLERLRFLKKRRKK